MQGWTEHDALLSLSVGLGVGLGLGSGGIVEQILASNNIQSAPVFDRATDGFTRLLDFRDLAETILSFVQEQQLTNNNASLDEMLDKISIQIVSDNFHIHGDLTKQQPFFCVKEDDKLYDAVKILTHRTTQARVYRVVVLSSESKDSYSKSSFSTILSQTDAIRFIASQLGDSRVSQVTKKSLSELKLVQAEIVSIQGDKQLLNALQIMIQRSLSSLAVVNDEGSLIGVISFSNIRYLFGKRLYAELKKSCANFVAELQQSKTQYDISHEIISPETSLEDCIKRIVAHHFHRVWIVEARFRPVGVVSLTDILRALT